MFLPIFVDLRHLYQLCKVEISTVDRVRSQYQSVSRKRQASVDDMEMKREQT